MTVLRSTCVLVCDGLVVGAGVGHAMMLLKSVAKSADAKLNGAGMYVRLHKL